MRALKRFAERLVVKVLDTRQPPLESNPLRQIPPQHARGVVVSFYMPNISRSVVAAQQAMLEKYAPPNVAIQQIMTRSSHSTAVDTFLKQTVFRCVIILDIDCVPIRSGAFDYFFERAEAGALIGAAQRADHIENSEHIYAAPFCMGFALDTYKKLGSPSFEETARGDVGEEFTYLAEQSSVPVDFIWPTSCEKPLWPLVEGKKFGLYTTYGDAFLHAFQIRALNHQRTFVRRINQLASV